MYSACTRNTEKNILILVFMVFLSLFFSFGRKQRHRVGSGLAIPSAEKKKKKIRRKENHRPDGIKHSQNFHDEKSENTQGLGSHPFDKVAF